MNKKYLDCGFQVKAIEESGAFEGYGSIFGNIDHYGDIVEKGAFTTSLGKHKQKGTMPALLWQHKGSEPIGVYTDMYEDENGLYVKGQLALKTAKGQEAYELLKMKALSGLSIGFNTVSDEYDQKTNIRNIKEVDLWEISLVTFPANESARISALKSIEEIKTLSDAENYLRESGGYSKSEAVGIVSRIKSACRSESDELGEVKAALESLQSRF